MGRRALAPNSHELIAQTSFFGQDDVPRKPSTRAQRPTSMAQADVHAHEPATVLLRHPAGEERPAAPATSSRHALARRRWSHAYPAAAGPSAARRDNSVDTAHGAVTAAPQGLRRQHGEPETVDGPGGAWQLWAGSQEAARLASSADLRSTTGRSLAGDLVAQ